MNIKSFRIRNMRIECIVDREELIKPGDTLTIDISEIRSVDGTIRRIPDDHSDIELDLT